MKILAIVGSSKNGNTTETVRYFEKKLRELGPVEVDYLYLSDYPMNFCTGCHNCIFLGEDKCPHREQVNIIEEKMLAADGIILATPGYMFSVTGIMKNFLDHVAYNCHRPKYFGKKAFLLSACTRWQAKSVFTPMETWASGAGFKVCGKSYLEMWPMPLKERELERMRKTLGDSAARFYRALESEEPIKPDFGGVMVYYLFRGLCGMLPQILQADHDYFVRKQAADSKDSWYVPAKISRFKHFFARFIEKRMRKGIAKMVDFEAVSHGKGFRNKL